MISDFFKKGKERIESTLLPNKLSSKKPSTKNKGRCFKECVEHS